MHGQHLLITMNTLQSLSREPPLPQLKIRFRKPFQRLLTRLDLRVNSDRLFPNFCNSVFCPTPLGGILAIVPGERSDESVAKTVLPVNDRGSEGAVSELELILLVPPATHLITRLDLGTVRLSTCTCHKRNCSAHPSQIRLILGTIRFSTCTWNC